MNIGFIGFGKVNQTLAKKLIKNHTLYASTENRSTNTKKAIKKQKIKELPKDTDLIKNCELIISANTPKNAIKTASKFKNKYKGLYLDLNNINPETTLKIEQILNENFIDGAIIGNIKNLELLILAGPSAKKLEFFNNFIKTEIISEKTGDASKIKMLRSIYTKGLSALLIETTQAAKKLNMENQLWTILETTENKDFKTINKSRINNTEKNKTRKIEEIKELNEFLEDINTSQTMTKSTYKKFKEL